MGDKKKKASKGKAGEEEDDSTLRLMKVYRKKCDANDIAVPSKLFKDKVDIVCEEGENLKDLHMWEELGPVGVRSIFEAFLELQYKHLTSVKL